MHGRNVVHGYLYPVTSFRVTLRDVRSHTSGTVVYANAEMLPQCNDIEVARMSRTFAATAKGAVYMYI